MTEEDAIKLAVDLCFEEESDGSNLVANQYDGYWMVNFKGDDPRSVGGEVFVIDPNTGESAPMPSLPPEMLVEMFKDQQAG